MKTDIRRVCMQRLRELLAPLQHTVGTRALYGIDSRVVCGSVRKGRSSSYRLNGVQRTLTGYLLAARILPCLIWVGTKSNPSDHPSRGAPLPAPEPPPAWAAPHLAPMVRAADAPPHAKAVTLRQPSEIPRAPPPPATPSGAPIRHGLSKEFAQLHGLPRPGDLRFLVDKALAHHGRRAHLLLRGSKGRAFLLPPRVGEKRGRFKEFWAGYGDLTTAVGKQGVATAAGVDAYPAGNYDKSADLIRAGVLLRELESIYYGDIRAAHWGITSRTWGFLFQNLGPGTRKKGAVFGDGRNADGVSGNLEAASALLLMQALWTVGGVCTLEHPRRSYLFQHPGLRLLGGSGEFNTVITDQCEYGLRPSDDPFKRYQKNTGLFGNLPSLDCLGRRCRGEHEHVVILGKVPGTTCNRSTEAGRYPPQLCRQMGRLLAQALKARGRR